ncbi:MAG: ketopantoate reductase family protein [Mycobacteriales bacterium]
MRYIVMGAGAIGGVIGARLHQAGEDVVLIARGRQLHALQSSGLTLKDELGHTSLSIRCVGAPSDITWRSDDVTLLTVKSQDTSAALSDLGAAASPDMPLICAQNGVSNERQALRLFARVYGACVNCPADNPRAGGVATMTVPTGMLDIGRFPQGRDAFSDDLVGTLRRATFDAQAVDDVMARKYSKLLLNLANAARITCRDEPSVHDVIQLAIAEGKACLEAADISYVPPEEALEVRRARLRPHGERDEEAHPDWRLRQERTWASEADHLNGEIVLLGREHGVATPINAALQALARRVAHGAGPGLASATDILSGVQHDRAHRH